jgi:2-polyprenyl-3-methyl-5-hydroxy-6-metoxy-1,4-benzoquinol methylase
VAAELLQDPAPLPLLDIGCGLGLLGLYLHDAGFRAPVLGIDYDRSKIEAARRAAGQRADLRFDTADARLGLPAFSGQVCILDILQYFSGAAQESLVREAAARVAPGGLLLIRTGLREDNWRFRLTRAADRFARLAFWMKGSPVAYPGREPLENLLRHCGLEGQVRPLYGRTPFNNYLFAFRRPGAPAQPDPGGP